MVSLDNPKSVNLIFPSSEISKLSGLMSLYMIYICYGINNNRQKKFLSYFPRILASCFMKNKKKTKTKTNSLIHPLQKMVVRSTNIASFSFTRSQSSISMDKATVTINRELYEKKTNKQTNWKSSCCYNHTCE